MNSQNKGGNKVNEVKDTRELILDSSASFDNMFNEAVKIQTLCKDYNIVNANGMNTRFDTNSGVKLIYAPDDDAVRKSAISRYAMSQLCSKLGVPVRYIDKCINEGMLDLVSDNMNAWLEDYNKNLLIREYNNQIRGVLSDRYSVLDAPDILTVLDDVVDGRQYNTKGYFLTPERFHARVVQKEMMSINGEDLFAGVQIDSSDVGRSILSVKFFIFKQVCTNGLTVTKGGGILFEQKHIGISSDDFRLELKDAMSRIPLLEQNAKEMIERLRRDRFTSLENEETFKHFTEQIKQKTKLSDEAVTKVVEKMNNLYTPTKWGLINSITDVAKDYTLERRLELEKIAGEMLQVA